MFLGSLEDCLVGLLGRGLLCLGGLVFLPALLVCDWSESYWLESCLLGGMSFQAVVYVGREGKWLPVVFRLFLVQLSLPRR